MPNHIKNRIVFDCTDSRFREILKEISYRGKDGKIPPECSMDFNTVIPMPDNIFRGNLGREEYRLYGKNNWYDWSIANWGTKWNSYGGGYDESRKTIWFLTAWSAPHPVMSGLAKRYPGLSFSHEWADEDIGQNLGRVDYRHGVIERVYETARGSMEAVRFALRLWDYTPGEVGLCENDTHTKFIRTDDTEYDVVDLFGKEMLFSNARLTRADIPAGWHVYHLRTSDDGDRFCTVEETVMVNHGGSLISREALDLGPRGFLAVRDETEPNFLGYSRTLGEYAAGLREEQEMEGGPVR